MQSRAKRANALSSKRGRSTETVPSAAQDRPASGPLSPATEIGQQQALMQVIYFSLRSSQSLQMPLHVFVRSEKQR